MRRAERRYKPATPVVVPRAPGPSHESAGQPLEPAARDAIAPRFGHDFSHVRVHTDATAAQTARSARANAVTIGNNLYFDSGRYQPFSEQGRFLLAHELAHTLQQRTPGKATEASAEKDANRAAAAAVAGGRAKVGGPASGRLQRQDKAAADADVERSKIVDVSKKTQRDPRSRAWEIGWRMLTRYFPEYSPNVSGVGYEEKEPGVHVDAKEYELKGKKVESAMVTLGKRFVTDTSEDTLRERIEEMRMALSSKMKAIPDPQKTPGLAAVRQLIQKEFPDKLRRVASIEYDRNLPGLSTEFKAGTFQAGSTKITLTGPRLYFGKAFLDIPDEGAKAAKLKAELAKIDEWAVENAQLTKDDLKDDDITLRIRGLGNAKLTSLRDKVVDPAVKEYCDSLLTRSTPIEKGLAKQPDGSVSEVIGNVTVVLLPDVSGVQGIKGGKTTFDAPPASMSGKVVNGKMTNVKGPPPTITIKIQTKYGPGVDPTAHSGYGRGTTERDKSVGGTSLRTHEGSHGLDMVQFIKDNPFPVFTGHDGQPQGEFNKAWADYRAKRKAFFDAMDKASVDATDCVGITIDEYNQQNSIKAGKQCK